MQRKIERSSDSFLVFVSSLHGLQDIVKSLKFFSQGFRSLKCLKLPYKFSLFTHTACQVLVVFSVRVEHGYFTHERKCYVTTTHVLKTMLYV